MIGRTQIYLKNLLAAPLEISPDIARKVIVVFTHSRASLLADCLSSLKSAYGFEAWHLVVVHQKGVAEVELVIQKNKEFIDTLIEFKANYKEIRANIDYSRLIGTKFAFENLSADYVLGVEEDTIISKGALNFIDFVSERYQSNRAFRGVNLGSVEPKNEHQIGGYSLLRFGLHGQAGVLNKRSWSYIAKKQLFEVKEPFGWDSKIEFYLKSGFMVTPNISRDLDFGWGGTHAPSSPTHPYYLAMQKSFASLDDEGIKTYTNIEITHTWRKDAVNYKKAASLFYFVRRSGWLYLLVRRGKLIFLKETFNPNS